MIPIAEINGLTTVEFIGRFGGVYEHSSWVAGQVADRRPFKTRDALVAAMRAAVDAASDVRKLELIQAHPDLAGKLARAGKLTAESTGEQSGLGLDRLSDTEYARFSELNERYRARFGFPFIICARMTTREGVVAAFEERLGHDTETEIAEALHQIHHIARLRIEDLVVP